MLGDWFLLTCKDQMIYKFLMTNAQETKALTIGGVAPLNMVSCVSVKCSLIKSNTCTSINFHFFSDFKNYLLVPHDAVHHD